MPVTPDDVFDYIATAAESFAEDDLNEDGEWSEEDHAELIGRVMDWCRDHKSP